MVHSLTSLVVDPTQHFGQGPGCSHLLMERGDPTLFGVPSSVNRRLRAVGDGEWYLHLKRNVHGDLWKQEEYMQHEVQAVFKGHALTLCEGMNGGPDLVPHVS